MSVFLGDQTIHGYRILRLLGKGGMAEVYEVEAEKTGAFYALKVFVCEQANAVFLKKRFWSEARILSRLQHPRIVRVYDFGYVDADEKTPYYVMDLVLDETGEPCSLRDALERGVSTEERIASWYGDLVEALAYIHAKGVIHRDVSLENALVGPDGRVVLSDFGVCKILDRDLRTEMNQTLVTMMSEGRPLMGKAFYIAPEVRAGKSESPASDLYSLGVLLFYLLNQVWYTPGAKIEDLLALFDEQWQTILPALLNEHPDLRHAPQWVSPQAAECGRLENELREQTTVSQRFKRTCRRLSYVAVASLVGGMLLGGGGLLRNVGHARNRSRDIRMLKDANVSCTLLGFDMEKNRKESVRRVRPSVSMVVFGAMRQAEIDPSRSAAERILEFADLFSSDGDDESAIRLLGYQAVFFLAAREGNDVSALDALLAIGAEDGKWQQALLERLERLPDVDVGFCKKIRARMKAYGSVEETSSLGGK